MGKGERGEGGVEPVHEKIGARRDSALSRFRILLAQLERNLAKYSFS